MTLSQVFVPHLEKLEAGNKSFLEKLRSAKRPSVNRVTFA